MEIIPYQRKYEKDFIQLNTAWIERYFTMEEDDLKVLNHVEDFINSGSMIFFALEDNQVLATCMVMPLNDNVWELCKLAAKGQYTGKGAGSAVMKACMDYAITHGATKLTFISNRKLKPALHIYEKMGFREVPLTNDYQDYERADIQFELIVEEDSAMPTKMVIKKEDAKKRTFKGVSLDSLAVGEKSMVTKMNYVAGNFATMHTHPHEQSGYVISGKYRMIIDEQEFELNAGDSYSIPGNIPHSFEVLEAGEVVDVFTPIREDYL
ncbi:MAG: GNAT family N-acetyltransferase [Eubacterium sp.]